MPRSACRQRTSASQPVILLSLQTDARLVVDLQRPVRDRLAQIRFQHSACLYLRVHVRLEETTGPASRRFGRVHCQIRVLQDLIQVGAMPRSQGNADTGIRW